MLTENGSFTPICEHSHIGVKVTILAGFRKISQILFQIRSQVLGRAQAGRPGPGKYIEEAPKIFAPNP